MGAVRRFAPRLVSLVFVPIYHDAALAREVASHLTMLEEDHRRRGRRSAEAPPSGPIGSWRRGPNAGWSRDARTFLGLVDDAPLGSADAMCMLGRPPVGEAIGLFLGDCIGLNAAVFSVVDWVLPRPLPYPQPHRGPRVHGWHGAGDGAEPGDGPGIRALRRVHGVPVVGRVYDGDARCRRVGRRPRPCRNRARDRGSRLATLGVVPEVGRGFSREEIAAGSPVVVVSQTLRHRQFAADRTIVGRVVAHRRRPAHGCRRDARTAGLSEGRRGLESPHVEGARRR